MKMPEALLLPPLSGPLDVLIPTGKDNFAGGRLINWPLT
jgi:hypothetical protein